MHFCQHGGPKQWVIVKKEYEVGVHSLKWKVSREWSPTKEMKAESQTLRSVGSAKFNVDGAQLNASEVSQVSVVFFITSTERSCFPSMWEKKSNEVEATAIPEVLDLFGYISQQVNSGK